MRLAVVCMSTESLLASQRQRPSLEHTRGFQVGVVQNLVHWAPDEWQQDAFNEARTCPASLSYQLLNTMAWLNTITVGHISRSPIQHFRQNCVHRLVLQDEGTVFGSWDEPHAYGN